MSAFTKGLQNANNAFDGFEVSNGIVAGSVAVGVGTTCAVAHGLGATPDWVIAQISGSVERAISWEATATTLTFNVASTTDAGPVISYLAGNLS